MKESSICLLYRTSISFTKKFDLKLTEAFLLGIANWLLIEQKSQPLVNYRTIAFPF